MNPVRVLVANQPRLMRELILALICDHPDIEIVGEIQQDSEIDRAVEQTHPDVLIVDLKHKNDASEHSRRLLSKYPEMKILALASKRNTSIYYWVALEVRSSRIEVSENNLVSLLRGEVPETGVGDRTVMNGPNISGRTT